MTRYFPAQVCLNGHLITDFYELSSDSGTEFCPTCGEKTIIECPNCNAQIRGHREGENPSLREKPHAYCHNCGSPFPWTANAIRYAAELYKEEMNASDEQAAAFEENVTNVVKGTPAASLAASRLKKVMVTAGTHTAGVFRDILINVVSDPVAKSIWGP